MNIFFHPLVLQPRLVFTNDSLGLGFQEYFVTAYEFRGILRGLWRNGWSLVDAQQAAAGHVMVPVGRKPLVLSEDDVNCFVAKHPEFSVNGAKGVLALTGYEGLLGYHHLQRPAERQQLEAVVSRLKATGWTFASHTYGHIDLTTDSVATIARDTMRWKYLAVPFIGTTNMLIYPFGARPTAAGIRYLKRAGFTIQFDIDIRPRRYHRQSVTVMSRLHIDGYGFQAPQRMRQLFSVRRVIDPNRPWPMKA